MSVESPVGWANNAFQRTLVPALFPLKHPPVLVISMPRSGSSWVGDVLGNSPLAMYLREPLTQSYLDDQNRQGLSFWWLDPTNPPPAYQEAVAAIAEGVPSFGSSIVRDVDQWRPLIRRQRRVVVKEVNPFALPWLMTQLSPTVIYLLRHPAAVAASFNKMGWGPALDDRLPDGVGPAPTGSPWVDSIHLQAVALRRNLDALEHHPDHRIVLYEDLCLDPVDGFRELYEFAGLVWTAATEAHTERRSAPDEIDDAPYTVSQPSEQMIDAWREAVGEDDLAAMRAAWIAHGFSFYPAETW